MEINKKRRPKMNSNGYVLPRFNLEGQKFAWLKELRSASSRATAKAVIKSAPTGNTLAYMVGPTRLLISSYEFEIPDLPEELDNLKIVHLSDIHHGPWLPIEFVDSIVDRVNQLKPDLIALTGDYVVNSPRYIEPVAASLARLQASIGTVAVLGNHDWWEGAEKIRQAFQVNRIPLIDNSRRFVTVNRRLSRTAQHGLCLAGVGDAWEDEVNFDRALDKVPGAMPRIVLSHNPDCAEDSKLLVSGHRIDLMLSGHTHGGQVCFPNKQTPMLPKMRKNRYVRGMVLGPVCPVYVSRGLGTAGVPVRMGAAPEITEFNLVRKSSIPRVKP